MTTIQLLEAKGINLKGRTGGQIKTVCPQCSHERKNKKDPCLSVNVDDGAYTCHNCSFKGRVFEKRLKEFQKPVARLEKLGTKTLNWFEQERKISNNTLLRFGVSEATEPIGPYTAPVPVICFNYYRDEDLINIKFRGPRKSFKMAYGAELVFYNLNALKNETEAIIVEGEIDCLSLHEAGFYNSVSVPNGASKGSQKLEYLDNCWESFIGKRKVILAVDADEPGNELREELARRIGKDRCFKVIFPEGCKDANEVLIKHGKEGVKELVNSAYQWPIEGIHGMDDMIPEVNSFYENGYPKGFETGIAGLDDFISFMPGQYTTITGIPGSGKSEFTDWMMCKLAERHEWGWAVCSFENQPAAIHVSKLIEKFAGKSFAFRKDTSKRLNAEEMEFGVYMVSKWFHFLNLSQVDLTLDGILDKTRELVLRKGVKGLIIDPWNYIEHKVPEGYTETQYISECLTLIRTFALQYGVHIFLIAHPTKIQKDLAGNYNVPTLYNISGSAHFFNKTDNGLTVYRDYVKGIVTVYIQKIRFSWLGKIGFASFRYDTELRQYMPLDEPKKDRSDALAGSWTPVKSLPYADDKEDII
jgi:twinkle protein